MDCIIAIFELCADAYIADEGNCTPMFRAACGSSADAVRALIDLGAGVNTTDESVV